MTQLLVTGDDNANQQMELTVEGRPNPLVVRTQPLGVSGNSGSARATTGNNVVASGAAGDTWLEITGNQFVQVNGSTSWAFNPNTCFWTYTGVAGKRFLWTLESTVICDGDGNVYMAIDVDQALAFGVASTSFTESVVSESFSVAEANNTFRKTLTTTRLVSGILNPGLVQPVFAHDNGNIGILRLSISWAEVGPGT